MTGSRRHIEWHLAGWAALYILWVTIFGRTVLAFTQTLTVQFCYLVFVAANYYFNVYWVIPRLLYQSRYPAFLAALGIGVVVTAACRVPVAMYLNEHYFLAGRAQPPAKELFISSLLNIFAWVVFIVAGKVIVDRYRLQKEKAQAELAFLNAQFNPHFLFNSINSIYGHIDKHNTTARQMLLTFSEMLRYQLYECNTESILIDKEIAYLRNYVAMQKARKEESLVVELEVDPRVKGFAIAPLLFITFIENAFKYVSNSEEKENKVVVRFSKTERGLDFFCFNTKERVIASDRGIGINNARRRMALLYPGRHLLAINDSECCYEILLNLQLS